MGTQGLAFYGAIVGMVLLAAFPAMAQDRPRRDPPRAPAPVQRPAAKAPIKPDAAKAEQARIEAACVRYRAVWGMDCPTENGSGANGVDPLKDVRRLGVQPPAKKK